MNALAFSPSPTRGFRCRASAKARRREGSRDEKKGIVFE
jgi:hypothetical protein